MVTGLKGVQIASSLFFIHELLRIGLATVMLLILEDLRETFACVWGVEIAALISFVDFLIGFISSFHGGVVVFIFDLLVTSILCLNDKVSESTDEKS